MRHRGMAEPGFRTLQCTVTKRRGTTLKRRPATANLGEGNVIAGRNKRLFLQAMVGGFLSGATPGERDAALLRRTLRDRGNQQHVLSHASNVGARAMVGAGARPLLLHAEGS